MRRDRRLLRRPRRLPPLPEPPPGYMYDPTMGDGCGRLVPIEMIGDDAADFMADWDGEHGRRFYDSDHYTNDPSYTWAQDTKAKRAALNKQPGLG